MHQLKHDRTLSVIMKAAQNIIQTEGFEKITVRHLAEATGYSHTVFYHYFKNLHALLCALRLEMIEDMISELSRAPQKASSPVDGIVYVFSGYACFFMANPNIFRFFYFYPFSMQQDALESTDLENRFQSMWQESFACLVLDGIISQEDVFLVAKTIIYTISGMLLLSLSSGGLATPIDIEHEIKDTIHFLLHKNDHTR